MKEQNQSPDSSSKPEKKTPLLLRDPNDGPYVGNIWGWKFSIIGAVVISLMVALMVYRYSQLDEEARNAPFSPMEFNEKPKQVQDVEKEK